MTKIYVGNLPFSATDAEVRELFAQHGTVESVSLITDRETGRSRFGYRCNLELVGLFRGFGPTGAGAPRPLFSG